MKFKTLSIVGMALCLVLPACRKQETPPAASDAPGPYVVGIFQSVDSPTANEVRRGILQAFAEAGLRDGREIVVTIRIANNDIAEVQTIARELAGRVDMIIPLSTQALQAAILTSRKVPIVFGAVAVPYLVGAGQSADEPSRERHRRRLHGTHPPDDGPHPGGPAARPGGSDPSGRPPRSTRSTIWNWPARPRPSSASSSSSSR